MNTKGLTFAELDDRLNRAMPEGVIVEAYPLPDGNGYMTVITRVKCGVQGDIMTDDQRYATQGAALGAGYWKAVSTFKNATWIQLSED